MKNILKGMIIFLCVILVSLIGLLIFALARGDNQIAFFQTIQKRFTEYTLINTQTITLDEITNISITGYSSDVIFYNSETNDLIVKEYVASEATQESFVTIQKEHGTLTMEENKNSSRSFFVFGNNGRYVEVYLPLSYQNAMNVHTDSADITSEMEFMLTDANFISKSGYISLNSLQAEELSLSSDSGDICATTLDGKKTLSTSSGYLTLENCINSTDITTTSGDVTLQNADGDLTVSTTSGYVNITNLNGNSDVSTSSGDIHLTHGNGTMSFMTKSGYINGNEIDGSVTAETSSGSIQLDFTKLKDDLKLQTTSGDVTCGIPKDTAFEFTAMTNSGDISTYFDNLLRYNKDGSKANGTIGTASDLVVQIQTSSGSIHLHD